MRRLWRITLLLALPLALHASPATDMNTMADRYVKLVLAVGPLRRSALRRELQQVCVELGLGCEIDERRRLLTTRLHVLVRGTREGVDALLDYARVSGWSTRTDDALG